ncbi:MAG: insulinase family protein, partial [Muribaculaceae bacterium]|nr:insulinase family protein [Muribaculaceae bacterium]
MRRNDDMTQMAALSNGLRLVHRKVPGAPVDYCGVVIYAGSRDDEKEALGTAHFVEHTIFKGTLRRQSWHIINRMERIGGELNAYTTKEETVVYTAAPSGNMPRAMELISDLIINSRFPSSELDKERDVIIDEIKSYLDSPAEAVYD